MTDTAPAYDTAGNNPAGLPDPAATGAMPIGEPAPLDPGQSPADATRAMAAALTAGIGEGA